MTLLLIGALDMKLKQSGFTLLELLIYIAISSIIIIVIAQSLFTLSKGRGFVSARSEVASSMRFSLEKIAQDIRFASSVVTPSLAGESSPSLALIILGTNVYYCIQGGEFRRESGVPCSIFSETISGNKVIIDSITFTRLENTNVVLSKTAVSIMVDITMSYNSASPDWAYTETKRITVSLR